MPYDTQEKKKAWRSRNKKRLAINEKNYRDRLRRKAMRRLGTKCVRCGFDDERALQIDHINGGGVTELRAMHRAQLWIKIREMHSDELRQTYQLLCANCNWIKKAENNENPYQDPNPPVPSTQSQVSQTILSQSSA